jgi:hypothetical protein
VAWHEACVADRGVHSAAAGEQMQPSGQTGLDGLAGQVDQEVVAPPRPGHHDDEPVGLEQRHAAGQHGGDAIEQRRPAAVGQIGRLRLDHARFAVAVGVVEPA